MDVLAMYKESLRTVNGSGWADVFFAFGLLTISKKAAPERRNTLVRIGSQGAGQGVGSLFSLSYSADLLVTLPCFFFQARTADANDGPNSI
jgi:hypothetical protein